MKWRPKLTVERGPAGKAETTPFEEKLGTALNTLLQKGTTPDTRPKLRLFKADDGKWTVTETIGRSVVTWRCRSWRDAVAWRAVCWVHARLWVRNWGPEVKRD